jgi:hypothetical protein
MIGSGHVGYWNAATQTAIGAALVLVMVGASGCTSTSQLGGQPDATSTSAPPAPSSPSPPPVDLAGRWKFSVSGGGSCMMTFGGSTGTSDGSIAPAGGCPGNFFTSRKWTYEHDNLIIRNHKGEVLLELSFANGHFEGQPITGGGAVSLTR